MQTEDEDILFLKNKYNISDNPFRISPCKVMSQYVERKDELQKFKTNLKWLQQSSIESNLLIVGNKGIGKSSFLYICQLYAREIGLNTIRIESVPPSGKDFLTTLLKNT